jgi:hypothetical protein
MKKAIILLLLILPFSLVAQLRNSSWKGAIKGDNPRDVVLNFTKDSATLLDASGKSVIERMTYVAKGTEVTLRKIDGQSDCDNSVVGRYKFSISKGNLLISLLADPCDDRSSALNATKWIRRATSHPKSTAAHPAHK